MPHTITLTKVKRVTISLFMYERDVVKEAPITVVITDETGVEEHTVLGDPRDLMTDDQTTALAGAAKKLLNDLWDLEQAQIDKP